MTTMCTCVFLCLCTITIFVKFGVVRRVLGLVVANSAQNIMVCHQKKNSTTFNGDVHSAASTILQG